MNKSLLPITAVLLLACGQAFSQPADFCQGMFPISVCQGNLTCITQAQQSQAECRASQERGNRPVMTVPEPETALLFATGLIALALARKSQRKAVNR
jgi:hypothetical protein